VEVASDQIWDRKPHSVETGVVEPGTGLHMDINHKIEDQLEELKGKLDAISRI
jgi:hypothetical protein